MHGPGEASVLLGPQKNVERHARAATARGPLFAPVPADPVRSSPVRPPLHWASGGLNPTTTHALRHTTDPSPPRTGLCPEEPYFAAVAVRFARLGRRDWRRTGLSATFTTSRAG